jgi:hypothetical protein
MPTIEVSEEIYRKLERRAERLRTSIPEAARPLLDVDEPLPDEPASPEVIADRLRKFDEMMEFFNSQPRLYPEGHVVDVSRESIYEGCGE